jgi:hypothetical protein
MGKTAQEAVTDRPAPREAWQPREPSAYLTCMYENHEGDFAYTIRRRTFRSGKTVWRWEVRRSIGDAFVDCGISLRSHDAAETSALDAIFQWNFSRPPSKVRS